MNFNKYSELDGLHSFLSPSKYHWINYDEEKLKNVYTKKLAVQKGVELHHFASECIRLGIKLPRTNKTLNLFVNDAIGFRMNTEQVLYFSMNCFGTADAISFKRNLLRIHDLKTGVTPASIKQLEVYAAIFCLEYEHNPENIKIELRIYQSDEVFIHEPDPIDIQGIMNKIKIFDKHINDIRQEVSE